MKSTIKLLALAGAFTLPLGALHAGDPALLDYPVTANGDVAGSVAAEGGGDAEGNGTDPRDLSAKFMPYYRFNKIDNGLESHEGVLFGLIPIKIGELLGQPDYKWGITYEFPAIKYVDASGPIDDVGRKISGAGGIDRIRSIATSQGITSPIPSERPDDKVWGTGDLNMRLLIPFYQGEWFGMPVGLLTGFEHWFPTASDDLLGTGKWQVAPHLTAVFDLAKDKGIFLATMNFWRTSYAGDSDRDDIERYVGRHFLNVPFGQSGYYMLAELQTICDFKNSDDWEVWIGPEFGKILKPGRILYAKPGFGIDPDPDEREWSFEIGYRHFF